MLTSVSRWSRKGTRKPAQEVRERVLSDLNTIGVNLIEVAHYGTGFVVLKYPLNMSDWNGQMLRGGINI